ncbi:3D domain-containing protein [Neobacillus sp. NPDC093182]|uniref:3D domain-containing protein n=1 Tax=Neobacillus sp. NPDC093182 TaxID=3364297 RepID=UPI00382E9DEA
MNKFRTFIAVAALSVTVGANVLAAEIVDEKKNPSNISTEKEKVIKPLDITMEQPTVEQVVPKEENYTVKPNDTLSDIAATNRVSIEDIKEWNDLNTDIIHPGKELIIANGSDRNAVETEILADNEMILAEKSEASNEGQAVETADPVIQEEPVSQEPVPVDSPEETKEITVTATAYTASCEGCSGITATGVNIKDNPEKKVISVDPSVIPLGTEVYVEGYGYAVAADTGGAIKGNKIDVFIPDKQDAINWGKQQVEVKILN